MRRPWTAVVLVVLVIVLAAVVAATTAARHVGRGRAEGGAPTRKPRILYTPSESDIDPDLFRRMARGRGFAVTGRPSGPPVEVGFVRDHRARAPWKSRTARVWGRLTAAPLANKAEFLALFGGTGLTPPGWVVPPLVAGDRRLDLPEGVWMFRPAMGWGGWHARAVTTAAELETVRKALATDAPKSRAVVTRYIENPDLCDFKHERYKYHLRVWALAAVGDDEPMRLGYFRRARMIRAQKPYRRGDYGNPEIHDTHTQGDASVSTDFPEGYRGGARRVEEALSTLMTRAKPVFAKVLRPLPTAKAGFHLLGLDVMIDAEGRPWLIEVNTSPTFPTLRRDMSKDVYETLWGWAIDPLLGRAEPTAPETFLVVD